MALHEKAVVDAAAGQKAAGAPTAPPGANGRSGGAADSGDIRWMPETAEARMHELALKQSAGTMTEAEGAEYAALVERAQAVMVENARALTRRRGPEASQAAAAAERRALQALRRDAGRQGARGGSR